jgi:hypothetical protein
MGRDCLPTLNCGYLILQPAQDECRSFHLRRYTILHAALQRPLGSCGDDSRLCQQADPSEAQELLLLQASCLRCGSNSRRRPRGPHTSCHFRSNYLFHDWIGSNCLAVLHLNIVSLDSHNDHVLASLPNLDIPKCRLSPRHSSRFCLLRSRLLTFALLVSMSHPQARRARREFKIMLSQRKNIAS